MNEDILILNNPTCWPHYPLVPVKRPNPSGGWPTLGIVVAIKELVEDLTSAGGNPPDGMWEEYKYTVFVNADLYAPGDAVRKILNGEHEEKFSYKSYEEMIADGWIVD